MGYSVHGKIPGKGASARQATTRKHWTAILLGLLFGTAGPVPRIIVGSSTMVMLLIGPILLVTGSKSHDPGPRTPRGPPKASAGSSSLASDLAPASSTATVAAAAIAGPAAPAVPVVPPVPPAHHTTTIASWYRARPEACHDHSGKVTPLPPALKMWTAARTLPCGTKVEVDGPAGKTELLVEDHGPWVGPGRELDMSPGAFEAVVGPLSVGTASVTFWVVKPG